MGCYYYELLLANVIYLFMGYSSLVVVAVGVVVESGVISSLMRSSRSPIPVKMELLLTFYILFPLCFGFFTFWLIVILFGYSYLS
jgi:hypothetical protein